MEGQRPLTARFPYMVHLMSNERPTGCENDGYRPVGSGPSASTQDDSARSVCVGPAEEPPLRFSWLLFISALMACRSTALWLCCSENGPLFLHSQEPVQRSRNGVLSHWYLLREDCAPPASLAYSGQSKPHIR